MTLNEAEVKQTRKETVYARRLTVSYFQVDTLERDALQVVCLVRSLRNSFAPVNRTPPEVLSLIPDYWEDSDREKALIKLTHVCRGWRDIFISHPSLWTRLDCTNVSKTRVYIERSKSSPLEIYLEEDDFLHDAFLLTVPHLGRLGSLTISGSSDCLLQLTGYFGSSAPFLENLKLTSTCTSHPIIEDAIFDGNLPSLRKFHLSGAIVDMAWKNLSNLTTFDFRHVPSNEVSLTQLLNLFDCAPLLRNIQLWDAFPNSSDAPPEHIISLVCLESLTIIAQPAHSVLLNHLIIPTGVLLHQEFDLSSLESPIPSYLPETLENLNNISHITSISLSFKSGAFLRLKGPTGGLYMYGSWVSEAIYPPIVGCWVLHSLTLFDILRTERLAITYCKTSSLGFAKHPVYETFFFMSNLQTLTLTNCFNLPFILALNPKQTPSRTVTCPELEEIFLYVEEKDWFCFSELLEMARERASRGAKLSVITIVSPQELLPAKEVFKLRAHVSYVEYRLDDTMPGWDTLPDDADDTSYASDW